MLFRSEKLRLVGLTHKRDKKAPGAAPTASFHEKCEIATVFDEVSPGFDKEKYAAAEKKVQAEKVCSQLIQLILPCSVAMLSTYPRMNSCRTNSYRLPAILNQHMCIAFTTLSVARDFSLSSLSLSTLSLVCVLLFNSLSSSHNVDLETRFRVVPVPLDPLVPT